MEIINLGSTLYNNYVLKFGNGCILVDAGNKTTYPQFLKKLQKNGVAVGDIRYLFLTHSHDDHVSYLKDLLENTDIKVVAHSKARDRLLLGKNINGDATTKLLALFGRVTAKNGTKPFAAVDIKDRMIAAEDNPDFFKEKGIEEITIVPLSGHTTDNVGFMLNDILFAGDMFFNGFPASKYRTLLVEDKQAYIESWKRVLELKPKIIYVGHGNPIFFNSLLKASNNIDDMKLFK